MLLNKFRRQHQKESLHLNETLAHQKQSTVFCLASSGKDDLLDHKVGQFNRQLPDLAREFGPKKGKVRLLRFVSRERVLL